MKGDNCCGTKILLANCNLSYNILCFLIFNLHLIFYFILGFDSSYP